MKQEKEPQVTLMAMLLTPFMTLAGMGLALSLVVHLHALFGSPSPFGESTWLLQTGLFVVGIPTYLVIMDRFGLWGRKSLSFSDIIDLFEMALEGCPRWLKIGTILLCLYAFFNAMIFNSGETAAMPVARYSVPSGISLAMYTLFFALMYSTSKVERGEDFNHSPDEQSSGTGRVRKCPNHHKVSNTDKHCPICGVNIHEPPVKD